MTDPVRRAETYWMLAHAQVSAGDSDDAIATMWQALAVGRPAPHLAGPDAGLARDARAGEHWRPRRVGRDRPPGPAVAEEAGDPFATAHALTDLWLSHGVRRDHAAALDYVDRALRVLATIPATRTCARTP
jgi:hypothetical protein